MLLFWANFCNNVTKFSFIFISFYIKKLLLLFPADSKSSSKRNSLDSKTVQVLAQDLAAECAKAYALMESSLSKLSTEFSGGNGGVGPFGLTPKTKVSPKNQRSTGF